MPEPEHDNEECPERPAQPEHTENGKRGDDNMPSDVVTVTGFDSSSPMKLTGSATRNPTSGPETPTRTSALLVGTGDSILMKAPMVPVIGCGTGRK